MSNIKPLFPDTGRLIGKKLPTPIFERITLTNSDGDSDFGDLRVEHKISISFTIPPEERHDREYISAKDVLENYCKDLYLYVYVSPFMSINNALEEKRLNLRDLFDAYSDKDMTRHNFVGPGYAGTGLAWDFPTPLYPYVVEFQKNMFLEKTFAYYMDGLSKTGDPPDTILGYTLEEVSSMIDNKSYNALDGLEENPIFRIFWGNKGKSGRWNSPNDIHRGDSEDILETWLEENGYTLHSESSFMHFFLETSIKFLARGGYNSNSTYRRKIRLSNLLTRDDASANDSEGLQYTQEGEEIFKIGNIRSYTLINQMVSGTATDDGDELEYYTRRLASIDKLFSIAFVGLDIDTLSATTDALDSRSDSYGWGVPYYDADDEGYGFAGHTEEYDLYPRRPIMNAYFGNIVYEHILENSQAVINPSEAFYRVDNDTQYDEVPITGWNLNYYVQHPISRRGIIDSVKTLISEHSQRRQTDANLDNNLKNIEYILETQKDSTDILIKFRNYIGTYTHKSPATPSGRFYSEFRTLATQIAKNVMTQDRVTKRVFRNNILVDARGSIGAPGMAGLNYIPPHVYAETKNAYVSGTESEPQKFGYIPEEFARYTSNVMFKKGKTEDDDWTLDDSEWWKIFTGYLKALSGVEYGTYDVVLDGTTYYADLDSSSGVKIDDTVETYRASYAAGAITWDELTALAVDLTDAWFARNAEYSILGLHDTYGATTYSGFGPLNSGLGGWSSYDHRGDRVVINSGYWFFDWEKALHTHSAISEVLSVSALERFLGWKIPYRRMPILNAAMARRGGYADHDGNFSEANAYLECRMQGKVEWRDYGTASNEKSVPMSQYSIYSFSHSKEVGLPYAYCVPAGEQGTKSDSTGEKTLKQSYLKCVNFDVVNGDTFTGKRTLRDFTKWAPEWPFNPVLMGSSIYGDYRLVAFQFQDICDDDYAYYNYYLGHVADENKTDLEIAQCEQLTVMNSKDVPFAEYIMYVSVNDKTLSTISDISGYIITPVLDRFEKYKEYCEDYCSYNNIENQFNSFFADGMEEEYLVGTRPRKTTFTQAPRRQPPWFETPYLIAALRMITRREYKNNPDQSDLKLEELVMKEARQLSQQCNPRTGTLSGVENVLALLEDFSGMFKLEDTTFNERLVTVTGLPLSEFATLTDLRAANYSTTTVKQASELEYFTSIGGPLPNKCGFYIGGMAIDQPVFGEIILEGASKTTGDLDDAPEQEGEPYDVTEDDSLPPVGDAQFEPGYTDDILGRTAELLNDMLELDFEIKDYLVGRAGMVEALAAIEMALRLGPDGILDTDFLTDPHSWILDGTIIWESLVNVLTRRYHGTMVDSHRKLMLGTSGDKRLRDGALSIIENNMLNVKTETSPHMNIITQFHKGMGFVQPSFIASGGIMTNPEHGIFARVTNGMRGIDGKTFRFAGAGDYLLPIGATARTPMSLANVGVGAGGYDGFGKTGLTGAATDKVKSYTGWAASADEASAVFDMNYWAM